MILNTESHLVFAANASITLTNRIVGYLHELQEAARTYKGYRSAFKLKHKEFTVTILGLTERNGVKYVQVAVTSTESVTYTSPTYYSPEDDHFNEAWGADNTSGSCTSISYHTKDHLLDIPFSQLLLKVGDLRASLNRLVKTWTEQDALEAKNEKIARLEKELEAARKL